MFFFTYGIITISVNRQRFDVKKQILFVRRVFSLFDTVYRTKGENVCLCEW